MQLNEIIYFGNWGLFMCSLTLVSKPGYDTGQQVFSQMACDSIKVRVVWKWRESDSYYYYRSNIEVLEVAV